MLGYRKSVNTFENVTVIMLAVNKLKNQFIFLQGVLIQISALLGLLTVLPEVHRDDATAAILI